MLNTKRFSQEENKPVVTNVDEEVVTTGDKDVDIKVEQALLEFNELKSEAMIASR